MASSLKENYNSEYVRQSNRLTGRSHIVEVWVEDEYDVPFWNDLLNDHKGFTFRITPYRNKNLDKGKGNILKYSHLLGPNLIACVDSDYDYLLPNCSDAGRKMKDNPYILQTYSYAIENLNCHPSTLHKICINATLGDTDFDFVAFYREFSKAIYPLLIWSLIFRKEKMNGTMTFNDFKNIIYISQNVNKDNSTYIIDIIRKNVEITTRNYRDEYPDLYMKIRKFEEDMKQKGVTPENCFLFINGHILQDMITQRLLIPICKDIVNKHIEKIFRSKGTINEKERKKAHYDNITKRSLSVLLASNFDYKDYSRIYSERIRPTIEKLISRLEKEETREYGKNRDNTLYA